MTGLRVVLAAVVDGHPHPEGEGGFAVANGLAAVGVVLVGGDAVVGVEPVEGLLGVADGVALELGVGVVELVGEAGVVVAVAGVQVAAEAVGDLVEGPVAELVTAAGGRGLQVVQQLGVAPSQGVAVGRSCLAARLGWGLGLVGCPSRVPSCGVVGWARAQLGGGTRPPRGHGSAGRLAGGGHGPHLLSLVRSPAARAGGAGEAWLGSGLVGLGGAAGMGQADLAAGGQGAAGLAGLLGQQPAAFGGARSPWWTSRWSRAPVATRL